MKTFATTTLLTCLCLASPLWAGDPKDKPAPKPAGASTSNDAPTRETSLGTVRLFIKAIHEGDFRQAVELTDPAAEGYNNLQNMADAFDPETANSNMDKAMLKVVRDFFTKPWADVEPKLVAEQGPRAQYTLTFYYIDEKSGARTQGETRTVDLNLFEGKWYVLTTDQLFKPAVPQKLPEAPPASKPAAPKPEEPAKKSE